MAKEKAVSAGPIICVSCKREMGGSTKCYPFFADDGDNGEKTKHEAWCPRCFVYIRMLRIEKLPNGAPRHQQGMFLPIKCGKCGAEATAVGDAACPQCKSRNIVVLPPQPGVT